MMSAIEGVGSDYWGRRRCTERTWTNLRKRRHERDEEFAMVATTSGETQTSLDLQDRRNGVERNENRNGLELERQRD